MVRILKPLVLLGLLAAPAVLRGATDDAPALGGGSEEPEWIEAGELWRAPGATVGRDVRFVVQFDSWIERWNPYVTRFGSGEYRALSAWTDGQFPWRGEDYRAPTVRLFLRRGGAAEWAMEGVARYRRFEVVGRVRSLFAGEPWIEVLGVRPRVRRLEEGSLLHATRATELMEEELWARAADELRRALDAPLHDAAREELERLLSECEER